ncbi:cytochrome P450 [Kibdelosporangium aridum]|uniref:cytochrome P450 n=1 Tax=Kibdelosporangium aridum TaxID=2030 RepID=UPI0007C4C4CD
MATAPSPRQGDRDPYPDFRWLRMYQPVRRLDLPGPGAAWLVTPYDLAKECLADPRLTLDERGARQASAAQAPRRVPRGIMSLDGPDHLRLRKLLTNAFRSNVIGEYRAAIEQLCHQTIDRFAAAGETDLIKMYTLPVPVGVIYHVLGIPRELRLSPERCFALFYDLAWSVSGDPATATILLEHLRELIADKRANPGEDLLSRLVAELDHGGLHNEDELVALLLTLIDAGHVSTIQFLGTAILHLLRRPELREGLLSGTVSWKSAVTEMLRVDSAAQMSVFRYAVEDMLIGGVRIAKGDRVMVALAAANRDDRVFPEPDELKPDRDARAQLAFGYGAHSCVGSHLVRMETEVALSVLFQRLEGLRLAITEDEIVWDHGPTLRGLRALPVVFESGQQNGKR